MARNLYAGDYLIRSEYEDAENGVRGAKPARLTDEYIQPALTTDGKTVAMRVAPTIIATGEIGLPSLLTDGNLALVDGVLIECNDCNPRVLDTYTVTFAGLAGDFAPYNGAHTVNWALGQSAFPVADCTLLKTFAAGTFIDLTVGQSALGRSLVTLQVGVLNCNAKWTQTAPPPNACDPRVGAYTPLAGNCVDAGCVDMTSCALSAGATCAVT